MRALEGACGVGDRSGERALGVAEQLGFEQLGALPRAVDDDEGLLGAGPEADDGFGGQLFAGAGLAADQDRFVAAGDAREALEQNAHRDGRAQQAADGGDVFDRCRRSFLGGANANDGAAEAQLIVGLDEGVEHAARAEDDSVLRAEIDDAAAGRGDAQLAVKRADGGVRELEIVCVGGADQLLLLRARLPVAHVDAFHHLEQKPGDAQLAKGSAGVAQMREGRVFHVRSFRWVFRGRGGA